MSPGGNGLRHGLRDELRLDPPALEPSDVLVHQLADAARSAAVSAPRGRRRAVLALGLTTGTALLSLGGAWAVGVIEVPGLPPAPLPILGSAESEGGREGTAPRPQGESQRESRGESHERAQERAQEPADGRGDAPRARTPDAAQDGRPERGRSPEQGQERRQEKSQGRQDQGRGDQGREQGREHGRDHAGEQGPVRPRTPEPRPEPQGDPRGPERRSEQEPRPAPPQPEAPAPRPDRGEPQGGEGRQSADRTGGQQGQGWAVQGNSDG